MKERQLQHSQKNSPSHNGRRASAWKTGGLILVASAVTCLGILGIAMLAGASMTVTPSGGATMTVGIGSILLALVVTIGLGTLLLAVARKHRQSRWRFLAIAGLIFAILSLAAPLLSVAAVETKTALSAMHIATGLMWFGLIRRAARLHTEIAQESDKLRQAALLASKHSKGVPMNRTVVHAIRVEAN